MDKIKRILLVNIPTGKCNFKCPYCFITQVNGWETNEADQFPSYDLVKEAFDKKRFGGPCYINLCSRGETLIYPQSINVLKALLEAGHYVEVVTNGTIKKRFEEINKFAPELLSRLSFKFSFHFTELKRLKLMDVYFENIQMMKRAGASFTVELTPVDEEEPFIDEIKEICIKKLGALCHVTMARDDRKQDIPVLSKHSKEEYVKIWSQFDSGMLNFKETVFQQKRKEFCYAGDWSLYINLFTGSIQKCYCAPIQGNIYSVNEKIPFCAIGECPIAHCYNAHMLMTLGVLPEVETPYYSYIRNRTCVDGSEWLSPTVKAFYESKLIESNEEYSEDKKREIVKNTHALYQRIRVYKKLSSPFSSIFNMMSSEQKEKIKRLIKAK